MTETFAALIFAHTLADFVFQTGWIAANKRRFPVLLLHGAIVLAATQAATGRIDAWELLALAAVHIAIDWVKVRIGSPRIQAFLADQCAHILSLAALAWLRPELLSGGVWANSPELPTVMAYLTGAIVVTRAGSVAVGYLVTPFATPESVRGLTGGGELIGILERTIVFIFILTNNAEGVGFLIAAKSIIQIESKPESFDVRQYVIIGTLASFAWALAMAYATLWLASALPPIEITGAAN